MNRCPITYSETDKKYSDKGLKILSRNISQLNDIGYTAGQQRQEAALRAVKMSIQGVQPKLSAILNIKSSKFEIVDIKGTFIIKPQHHFYPQLPENEDLTMKLAAICGIDVPVHGMVYSADGSLSYFIKRFDRKPKNSKLPLEDFAQLAGKNRDTKYNYSIEKLVSLIEEYSTFPMIEKMRFFKRFLFNFLIGNEDMHLKNYSLITNNGKTELAPAYDFLNSSIVLRGDIEESALSIKGKKKKLNHEILIHYLGTERLNLRAKVISNIQNELKASITPWFNMVEISFLNCEQKDKYKMLLDNRIATLKL